MIDSELLTICYSHSTAIGLVNLWIVNGSSPSNSSVSSISREISEDYVINEP